MGNEIEKETEQYIYNVIVVMILYQKLITNITTIILINLRSTNIIESLN